MSEAPSNIEVAVANRFNDLAERFGLKPYQATAGVHSKLGLRSEIIVCLTMELKLGHDHESVTNPAKFGNREQYTKMLGLLGVTKQQTIGSRKFDYLEVGTYQELIDKLDNVIQLAPKARER